MTSELDALGAAGEGNLLDLIRANALAAPHKTALVCGSDVVDYATLIARVEAVAAVFATEGVSAGDSIGLALPNGLPFVVALLAAAHCGAAIAPMNTTLPPDDLRRLFEAAGCRHVIATVELLDALTEAGARRTLDGTWLTDRGTGAWRGIDAVCRIDAEPNCAVPVRDGLDRPLILTMTSGSTGDPKPIVLLQRTKVQRAASAAALYGVGADDVVLASTPLYHSLAERLVLMPLMLGATAVVLKRFSADHWMESVEATGTTFTICVSSQLAQLIDRLAVPDAASSLRCLVSSSAALPTPVKEAALRSIRFAFHECYGASEVAIATNLHANAFPEKLDTVGTPIGGVELRILGDDGTVLGPGEVGEIAVRTPMAYAGYLRQPQRTAEAHRDGFFLTGDLGRIDADGFLSYLGRKKELIITGGVNVYPADVERVARAWPGVIDAVACGVEDADLGEVIGLALALHDVDGFDLRAFRRHCATALADFQQPSRFMRLETLPLNALGKIDRRAIKQRFASQGSH